ncbi:MAG TPA: adenylate/guanylate cyclase domain-containing protein [Gaiellaceae bacterium]|nr:adenylate/guanylate cyclase domain-containing protein [Gaiellaceae bacterium]
MSKRELPSGTVTFLFTDIEGSTKLLQELGDDRYRDAVEEHRRILRDAFAESGGVEVDTQGDSFFVAFPTAPAAIEAAAAAREGLAGGPTLVRMGIHSGAPLLSGDDYVGADVHRAARIAAAGHGGQILLSAATAALVSSAELRDLGPHRLKDLSAPERIYQLGDRDFPPLKSLRQTNFPIPATPFIGRDRELGDVLELLSQDAIRLLTLTGAGGTGKTRLGLQVAAELAEGYRDGIWWVPLSSLDDSRLVLAAAGQVVGATNGLAEHVGERSLLMLFDNFEHVVHAAPQLAELVSACPNLDVVVTSREPLHVSGEQEYAVPPLSRSDGIDLFLARARAVRPELEDDDAVSEICARLDDLPLALELAAARVKVLSPAQILDRLEPRLPLLTRGARDLPERQRTLRATIDWSHDLLEPGEQELFGRLSVFRGGSTLQAAEDVAEADLDGLQSLVDKSLVRHSGERYWMLETIREYAAGRLEEAGNADELRHRHALYVLELFEQAEPHLIHRSREWLDLAAREHDNLRAAIECFMAIGEYEHAARLAGAAWCYWCERNHHPEGRSHLEPALEWYPPRTATRAKALIGAADMAGNAGDVPTMRLRAEEALSICREIDDALGVAHATLSVAQVAAEEEDYERARALFEEGARRFRELGEENFEIFSSRMLAGALDQLGDQAGARELLDELLERARAGIDPRIEYSVLTGHAGLAVREGRLDDAFRYVRKALLLAQADGERLPMRMALNRYANALALSGRPEIAATLLSCADALSAEITGDFGWISRMNAETLVILREQLDEDAFDAAWKRGSSMSLEDGVALALSAG